jgi:hypothetical protein
VRSLFPSYAHPAPGQPLDDDAWLIVDRPGERRAAPQVLGRIDLDLGARSLADVLAEVDAWRAEAVDGLFLDRAPAGSSGVGPVALAVRVARRRGLRRMVLNPGVPTHPVYRGLGAQICTFEGTWSAYQKWSGEGGLPGDGHLVHDVPTALLAAARRLLGRRGAGFGLATDAAPGAHADPGQTGVSAGPSGGGAGSAGS